MTAPIPAVHAWPERATRTGARVRVAPRRAAPPLYLSSLFLLSLVFFLFHFPYVRIRSIRSTRRAHNADRKLWRRARPSPPLPPSRRFSLRMRSMPLFRPSRVSCRRHRTEREAARRVTTAIRHPATHPTSGVFRTTSFRRATADGATCRCPHARDPRRVASDPAESYHRDRKLPFSRDNQLR